MNNPKSGLLDKALSDDVTDVYFSRTQIILNREGLNPVVTMEVFPNKDGILCGMREVCALLAQVLSPSAEVWALDEGDSMLAKEVVLRIAAPYQDFALYETAYLGILSHESGWATAARECVVAAGDVPVISFGARHVHPDVSARMEYAAILGGCVGCATTAGARLAGIEPSGTIPHALILVFGDTVKATQAFDRHIASGVNRIALVDTFKDEAEESLRVAAALGDRLWGVRLDTPVERGRVTPELVREVRARLDQAGYVHVKIVVSGGIDPARIRLFRERKSPVDSFGIGSAIAGAPPIDFTADIKVIEGRPVAKRGRIPGITSNPRLHKVDLSQVQA
ncbi:MAG: nicotinate phosphoribosyltransferase [Chloroflexota bacterium]|nr:nicotinate phosphoribosyltransferase [Chloroflexota bacterium]